DLDAESGIGWDMGVEQKIGKHHLVEATWFQNDISEQIKSQPFPAPPANVSGETTTEGLELGLRGNWCEGVYSYRLAWTYLHESLSDQPRNAATASFDWKPTAKVLVGAGVTHLADHSWGGDPLESFTIARLHASYQVTENVKLHARVENAFNESYELASFFGSTVEGAGTGVYAGITLDW
ncbi:MAG TPA: TonB-dependent receptor, partial [Luteolibacter sp.]